MVINMIKPYIHRVKYYETDMMGVTHHSNYLRWMEEARIDLLDQLGYPYKHLEDMGFLSPVLMIHTNYISTSTYDDEVSILVGIKEVRAGRFALNYEMTNVATGKTILTGYSEHCFINREFKPVLLKKSLPDLYEAMNALAPKE